MYWIYVNIAGHIFNSKIISMSEYNKVDIFGICFGHMVSHINIIILKCAYEYKDNLFGKINICDANQRYMGRIDI